MIRVLLVLQVIQWAVICVLIVAVLALARQLGLVLTRIKPQAAKSFVHGVPIGQKAIQHVGTDVHGRRINLLEDGSPTLLVFISPGCSTCESLLPGVKTLVRSEGRRLKVRLVSMSSEDKARRYADSKKLSLPVIASEDLAERYDVAITPYAFYIDSDGIVRASGLTNTLEHLESLITTGEDVLGTQDGVSLDASEAAVGVGD